MLCCFWKNIVVYKSQEKFLWIITGRKTLEGIFENTKHCCWKHCQDIQCKVWSFAKLIFHFWMFFTVKDISIHSWWLTLTDLANCQKILVHNKVIKLILFCFSILCFLLLPTKQLLPFRSTNKQLEL